MVTHYIPSVQFAEKEYKIVVKAKETHGGNWHDFLLDMAREYYSKKLNGEKK